MNRLSWLPWFVCAGCSLYACLFLYHAVCLLFFPYDMDNSEGLLLYQAMRIADGTFLYQPITEMPFLVDNYPPVYPALSAMWIWITGPSLFGLRLLSILATLGTAALIGFWVYLQTRNQLGALVGGLVYLGFYHVYQWGALARVDAVGGAFALAALVWFMARRDGVGTSVFLFLSLFTKQSLFAAPLALLVWLLCQKEYRSALRITLIAGGAGILCLMGLILLTGGEAYSHLVSYNANTFFLRDVWLNFRHWYTLYSIWGSIPVVFAVLLLHSSSNDDALLGWFSLFAMFEALLVGKIGSAPNYFLTACMASATGTGILFARALSSFQASPHWTVMISGMMIVQLFVTMHWPHSPVQFAQTPTRTLAQECEFVERELGRIEGRVFAELPTIAIRAGHPPEFQPFMFTQLTLEGRWDEQRIVSRVQQKEYERIVLQFDLNAPTWDKRRFTPGMIEAMRQHYQLDKSVGGYYLYRPQT